MADYWKLSFIELAVAKCVQYNIFVLVLKQASKQATPHKKHWFVSVTLPMWIVEYGYIF